MKTGRWWKLPLAVGLWAWAIAGMMFAVATIVQDLAIAYIVGNVPRWP